MKQNSYFKNLSLLLIIGFFLLSAVILVTAAFFSAEVFRMVFIVIAFFLILVLILFLTGFITISNILKKDELNSIQRNKVCNSRSFVISIALRLFMPFLLFISSSFNYRKEEIRRIYIKANNKYVLSLGKKVSPDRLLIVLPHCLQSSKCCHRMREGLNDCHQCGLCNLGMIKEQIQNHGVRVQLATGGTSARKAIIDLKPELVIAVACERDLSSGIMDVRGVPVYGILNKRPNGPCKDTFVNTSEIETAIKYFTIERD